MSPSYESLKSGRCSELFVLNAARVLTVTNRQRPTPGNVNQATTITGINAFTPVAYRFTIEAEVESMASGNCECILYFHVIGQVDVGGFVLES